MRHRKTTVKLGRKTAHRDAMFAAQVTSLIRHGRIRTTLQKAKASRRLAERCVTWGKRGTLAARRLAATALRVRGPGPTVTGDERKRWHAQDNVLKKLFDVVAPAFKDRQGGYTRITKLGLRVGDSSEMVYLEWTNYLPPAPREKTDEKAAEKPAEAKAGEAKA